MFSLDQNTRDLTYNYMCDVVLGSHLLCEDCLDCHSVVCDVVLGSHLLCEDCLDCHSVVCDVVLGSHLLCEDCLDCHSVVCDVVLGSHLLCEDCLDCHSVVCDVVLGSHLLCEDCLDCHSVVCDVVLGSHLLCEDCLDCHSVVSEVVLGSDMLCEDCLDHHSVYSRLNFNLGGFVEVALPCSKNRKLFVAEVIDVQEDEVLFRYMEAARGGFKWPTVEDVSWEHHSSVTRHLDNPVLDIQKSSNHAISVKQIKLWKYFSIVYNVGARSVCRVHPRGLPRPQKLHDSRGNKFPYRRDGQGMTATDLYGHQYSLFRLPMVTQSSFYKPTYKPNLMAFEDCFLYCFENFIIPRMVLVNAQNMRSHSCPYSYKEPEECEQLYSLRYEFQGSLTLTNACKSSFWCDDYEQNSHGPLSCTVGVPFNLLFNIQQDKKFMAISFWQREDRIKTDGARLVTARL
ncbi:hypothetical protein MAR_020731 [Mya arenaria]|uniref:Uncharacterized protein n=1 Tax=Mya arenaria TaxID=6604 RepID=A0ABY7E5S4_MYAAR|nr:hypothetical protein MAR_020731 [Mya arenaria]